MRYVYPVTLEIDEAGRVVASFPDVPEALTDGADEGEALSEARDALRAALAGYVQARRPLPQPSRSKGRQIALPPLIAAKLAIYQAMRERGLSNVALGARLGLSSPFQKFAHVSLRPPGSGAGPPHRGSACVRSAR